MQIHRHVELNILCPMYKYSPCVRLSEAVLRKGGCALLAWGLEFMDKFWPTKPRQPSSCRLRLSLTRYAGCYCTSCITGFSDLDFTLFQYVFYAASTVSFHFLFFILSVS